MSANRPRLDAALVKIGIVVLLGLIVSVIDGTVMVVAIDAVGRERLRVALTDPLVRAHVDHHARAGGQPGEEVRGVPPLPPPVMPPQR